MGTARASAVAKGGMDEPPLFDQLRSQLIEGLANVASGATKQSLESEEVETPAGTGLRIRLLYEDHPTLEFTLYPKQRVAFESAATELLFGGAASGGKSMGMRIFAIVWCHLIPGLQAYLFRRQHGDLWKNHMDGPTSFPELLGPWLASGHARIVQNAKGGSYIAIGRSKIHLCHLQHAKDLKNYQGAEIHLLLMDELTHFHAAEYKFLRSRVRLGTLKRNLPSRFRTYEARVIAASNPGSIGHNWVKATWIDPQPAYTIWRTQSKDAAMMRQFIPARLEDNPSSDADYEAKLEGIGNPALAKAMRYGDWNIVAGGFFDDLWNETTAKIIVVTPFSIPPTWKILRAFDWGSSAPFAVLWCAISDGSMPAVWDDGTSRYYPKGTVFVVAEWYGWNGEPNMGLRLTDPEIARGIVEREREHPALAGRAIKAGPADASIFDLHPQEDVHGMRVEHSIAKEMARFGVTFTPSDKRPGSRVTGGAKIRQMFKASLAERMELPGLFVFEDCRQVIRTIPTLPRDEKKPDDWDTNAEDHLGDTLRYVCLEISSSVGKPRSASQERDPVSYLPDYVKSW